MLGLKVCRNKKGGWSLGPQDWYDDHGAMELFNPLPDYCTEIKDAFEVVEHLSFLGSGFELTAEYRGEFGMNGYSCRFANFNSTGWADNAFADTAPMAICKAAIIFMEAIK